MATRSNELPRFSSEATELVDQLHDIAHDEDDPDDVGISWYLPNEEPPQDALAELVASGLFAVEDEDEERTLRFTRKGRATYGLRRARRWWRR